MLAAAAGLLLPLAVTGPPAGAASGADGGQQGALQRAFAEAAEAYDVPREVLLGVAYLQSRWDGHGGAPSVSGGYGPMHLTDARTALAGRAAGHPGHSDREDARGDPARAPRLASAPAGGGAEARGRELPARLRTLERAARLTGLSRAELRSSPEANIRGGAALLARAQQRLGHPLSSDPADWYAAVAAFPSSPGASAGAAFAGEVFEVIRSGERRVTDAGQRVELAARPRLRPDADQSGRARKLASASSDRADCPRGLSCEWLPAPYEEYTGDDGEADFGNHDKTRRPGSQKIEYIVVHDTEGAWDGVMDLIQDPKYVSWHYTLRSSDGHVAQHVANKDVAWHSGNWYVNSASIGLEHEGFLADPDAWFTEAMYRSSARLVRHLAAEYDIPLDRQHILGHDNVPGVTPAAIPDMHTDPGPYWDWAHYFELLGEPFTGERGGGARGLVTIRPDYAAHRPEYTGCESGKKGGKSTNSPCPPHGSGAVRLHTAPREDAPLVKDEGLHPGGGESTTGVNDTGARASTGQQYAVAGAKKGWTAVWYLGRKAWFRNPAEAPAAVPASGRVVTPRPGKDTVPVYGTAYPEESAYPDGVEPRKLTPLPYTVRAGQRYAAAGPAVRGTYLSAPDFDPEAEKFRVVRGGLRYVQIQLGHRVAFVRADDVRITEVGDGGR
ncbi:peptidoglycan recognition family protein [Streptomyces sp. HNM0574]|uniref:N-acetylmuramoyl-L-alanine amidase n=1 Tax=Streptomyces sp. HNM0574 TaxID=2714954 RepID=UPI0032172089